MSKFLHVVIITCLGVVCFAQENYREKILIENNINVKQANLQILGKYVYNKHSINSAYINEVHSFLIINKHAYMKFNVINCNSEFECSKKCLILLKTFIRKYKKMHSVDFMLFLPSLNCEKGFKTKKNKAGIVFQPFSIE